MANSLSVYRYSSFGLFILCNAVICCVSVWNLALAEAIGWNPLIDAYMIAISALGLLFIFPVMCIDLLRKNSLVGRVWFECVWLGLFWLLELAGAAAITAILPNMLCSVAADILPSSCTSTKVLLAFAWIAAVNLLVYFCILMVSAIIHMNDDSQVWRANTRLYPWYNVRQALPSPRKPSPLKTWSKPMVASAAPQIRLPSDLRSSRMPKSSTFDDEKLSAVPKKTPMTSNKSARILQSAWISATVTPASPPSDDSEEYGTSSSDLTSTPTGIPASAHYVPYSSTIKPSPLGTGPPPRSSSLSATFGQPPVSAVSQTPSRKGSLRSALPSPQPLSVPRKQVPSSATRSKSKRKSNRPPPLDMTRLHSTYGR
ncbi:hypothetical protein ACG7TL_002949 [Trametes sanguinea]